jgi:Holliday junction resolvase-like predicted endonuclease
LEQILPASRQRQRIYDSANYFLSKHPAISLYEMRFVVAFVHTYGRIHFIEDHFFDMM